MSNTTISVRSSGISSNTPSLGVLANGELALNYADGILYYKTVSNTLGQIKTTQPAGLNRELQFNDAGSFGSSSNLTFDKTNAVMTVTGTIRLANGTVSAPSIAQNSSSTTGLWFPAANTLAVSTAGTERLRVDSNGRVGIGTSSPATPIEISGNSGLGNGTGTPVALRISDTSSDFGAQTWNVSQQFAAIQFYSADSSSRGATVRASIGATMETVYGGFTSLTFCGGDGNRERMRISDAGLVGIGTTSPDALLTVNGIASFGDGAASTPSLAHKGDLNTGLWFPVADTVAVSTNGAERLRIDASGNVSIGTTSTTYTLQVAGSFAAQTKSFIITHPTQPTKKLQYGSLESPYHGVRLTGAGVITGTRCRIALPEYIAGLCHQEGAQVQITNIRHGKVLWVDQIDVAQQYFEVGCTRRATERTPYQFYWTFTGIRKDVPLLAVEHD